MKLLGGLSPAQFMRRHWQRRPLLVRQAWPRAAELFETNEVFGLAARDGVESRLVERLGQGWRVRHGPFARRSLPPLKRPGWTLLVQGVDHHLTIARRLLDTFSFLPAARLDDLMISWASDGGGVGPHIDSYDVFLLQLAGRRRWRVGPALDTRFVEDAPLKILRHFAPADDWLLEPGDMLYLPPRWAHDGVAEGGACMTASIGFRAPRHGGLAHELLLRLADAAADAEPAEGDLDLYGDAGQPATTSPGAIPLRLQRFAVRSLRLALAAPDAVERALGEVLSEPKPGVWFEAEEAGTTALVSRLAGGSRMLYDERHIFINGESYIARGRDATILRRLADDRWLTAADRRQLSAGARSLVDEWRAQGWLVAADGEAAKET